MGETSEDGSRKTQAAWLDCGDGRRGYRLQEYLRRMPAATNEVASHFAMSTERATALMADARERGLVTRDHRGRWHAAGDAAPAEPRWENLGPILDRLVTEYQARYGKPATSGIRADAPLRTEMQDLRAALNDLRTGAFQGGRSW